MGGGSNGSVSAVYYLTKTIAYRRKKVIQALIIVIFLAAIAQVI